MAAVPRPRRPRPVRRHGHPGQLDGRRQPRALETAIPGVGNSSPIVSNGRIFLTSAVEAPRPADAPPCPEPCEEPGPLERSLVALDAATGKLLWRSVVFAAPPFKHHMLNTNTAPTPVSDGRYVYAYFGSHLACFDFAGKLVWQKRSIPATSSTCVTAWAARRSWSAGRWWRSATRNTAWSRRIPAGSALRPQDRRGALADHLAGDLLLLRHPAGARKEGKPEIIVAHSGRLTAYDPENGSQAWSHEHPMLQVVSSLLADKDLVCYLGGADHDRGNLCLRVKGRGAAGQGRAAVVRAARPGSRLAGDDRRQHLHPLRRRRGPHVRPQHRRDPQDRPPAGAIFPRLAGGRRRGNVYAFSTSGDVGVFRPTADGKSFEIVAQNQLGDDGNNASPRSAPAASCSAPTPTSTASARRPRRAERRASASGIRSASFSAR